MSATLVLVGLSIGTYALKAAAPLLLGGRELPTPVARVADLVPAALLAALVVVSCFSDGEQLVVDARGAGLAAAAVALAGRAPFVVAVVAASLVTALVRLL